MEEKILIESEPAARTIPIVLIISGIVLFIITLATGSEWSSTDFASFMLFASLFISLYGVILLFLWSRSSMLISTKRVCGQNTFGSRVDIPLDSISSIASTRLIHGVSVASSSGKIKFYYLKNYKEVYAILSNLIISRQENIDINTEAKIS